MYQNRNVLLRFRALNEIYSTVTSFCLTQAGFAMPGTSATIENLLQEMQSLVKKLLLPVSWYLILTAQASQQNWCVTGTVWREQWIRRVETAKCSWKEASAVPGISQHPRLHPCGPLSQGCSLPSATVLVWAGRVDFLPDKPWAVVWSSAENRVAPTGVFQTVLSRAHTKDLFCSSPNPARLGCTGSLGGHLSLTDPRGVPHPPCSAYRAGGRRRCSELGHQPSPATITQVEPRFPKDAWASSPWCCGNS